MSLTVVAIIAVVVAVIASAASTYISMSQQAAAEEAQSDAAKLQASYARAAADQEAADQRDTAAEAERIGKIRREQVQEQSRRMLNRQGSLAGANGVVAFEGSLLENQLEAASLAEYQAQLAEMEPKMEARRLMRGADVTSFRGELSAGLNEFQSKLFRGRASDTRTYGTYSTIASGTSATASAAASLYGSSARSSMYNYNV